MKKTKLAWTLLAATTLSASAVLAQPQSVVVCLGGGAIPGAIPLPTKSLLENQTVKVFYYTENSNELNPTKEPEPVVQHFTASAITESAGTEKYTDPIQWREDRWCRKETLSGQIKCYGLMAYRFDSQRDYQAVHVEFTPGQGVCVARILGQVEGVALTESMLPPPRGSRRRS